MLKTIATIVSIVCMVLVIYDVLTKRPDLSFLKKIGWVIASVIFPIISLAVYYYLYRRKLW
jgi:multisubunit Na+/H+ antiporter MnhB subunit